MMNKKVLVHTRLVKNEDMNAAGTLFGGRMMEWCDEASAIYAFDQMHTTQIVTLKVSELIFKEPVPLGAILEFYATTVRIGGTSFTLNLEIFKKTIGRTNSSKLVLNCQMVFVAIGKNKKPIIWKK